MVTEVEVRAALDQVTHPTFGPSLIALNMVRAVRVSAERIEVDLVMRGACPGCPAGEVALAQARQALVTMNGGGGGRDGHAANLPHGVVREFRNAFGFETAIFGSEMQTTDGIQVLPLFEL